MVIAIPALLIFAGSAEDYTKDGVTYKYGTLNGQYLWYIPRYISGTLPKTLRILGQVPDGGDVEAILANAFDAHTELEEVYIPKQMKHIQQCAFIRCSSLKKVTFEGNLDLLDIPFQECGAFTIFHCSAVPSGTPRDLANPGELSSITVHVPRGYTSDKLGGVAVRKATASCGIFVDVVKDSKTYSFDGGTLTLTVSGTGTVNAGEFDEAVRNQCESCGQQSGVETVEHVVFNGISIIGADAFKGYTALKTVTPGAVSTLWDSCFEGCTALHNVNFATSIFAVIGASAFKNCQGLGDITLPATVRVVQSSAFCQSGLTSVTFQEGSSLKNIPDETFLNCARLASIVWPSSVATIGARAFKGCTQLFSSSDLTLPDSVTSIGDASFEGTGLTSLRIRGSSKLAIIEANSFHNCQSLGTVYLSAVTDIKSNAFSGCVTLSSVSLWKVSNIGASAFARNTQLKSIILPETLTNLEESAFEGCSSLSSVHIKGTTASLSIGTSALKDCGSSLTVFYCRSANVSGSDVFNGNDVKVYVHLGYTGESFAGHDVLRLGSESEIYLPVSADGLSYIFDGSKLTISGSGSASKDKMSSATCGQCASCSSTMARVSELFIGEDVGLSDGIFADCTSLKSVTYCGLSAPSDGKFFADGSDVVINVPSIYSDSSFGGRAVTKSSTVDEICDVHVPTISNPDTGSSHEGESVCSSTADVPTEDNPTSESASSNSNNTGLIAGIVVGLLVLVAVALVLIWFFVIRRRNDDHGEGDHELDEEPAETANETDSLSSTEFKQETGSVSPFTRDMYTGNFNMSFEELVLDY